MKHANYVCYRLPEQKEYIRLEQHHGTPIALLSAQELNGRKGFVFAPFHSSVQAPIWLLQADSKARKAIDEDDDDNNGNEITSAGDGKSYDVRKPQQKAIANIESDNTERASYHRRFVRCKEALASGAIEKVVMARRVEEPLHGATNPERLFRRACRLYPHQYIALICMEHAGTWLMATPEVLLSGDGTHYQTMALAGTQAMPDDFRPGQEAAWSEKNRKEQAFVAGYISERLLPLAGTIERGSPYTTHAAHLLHLRTDFRFTLREGVQAGDVIDALHPTPAVGGMPKDKAVSLILSLEGDERRYYSGYAGTIDPEGETRLFVTLRCMEIEGDRCLLHAGGGIVAESEESEEWKETEIKLNTMRDVLR